MRKTKQPFLLNSLLLLGLIFLPAAHPRPAIADTADALANGGFEQPGATRYDAFDWQSFGIGYRRQVSPHSGRWGIRLLTSNFNQQAGAYQRIDLNQTALKPVFIGGFVRGTRILKAPGGYLGASLYAEIHLQNGSIIYWNSIANFGTFSWRWIGFNTGSLPAVSQPINYILVVPILAQASGTAYFDDITVTEYAPAQAAVTLMFDDGEDTAYTQAKPVLDPHGFKGSIAMITEMINAPGFLTAKNLQTLQAENWEIVSHTRTHSDLTQLTRSELLRELSLSKSDLNALGLMVKNFALPFGTYNAEILYEAFRYYSSARAFEQGLNPQGTFPLDVKVRAVVESTTAADVSAWLAEAKAENRWIVLVFHTIAQTGDDKYHTAPEVFAQIIAEIAKSGVPVLTYEQGLKTFGIPHP